MSNDKEFSAPATTGGDSRSDRRAQRKADRKGRRGEFAATVGKGAREGLEAAARGLGSGLTDGLRGDSSPAPSSGLPGWALPVGLGLAGVGLAVMLTRS